MDRRRNVQGRRFAHRACALLLLAGLGGCARWASPLGDAPSPVPGLAAPEPVPCIPRFPDQQGWYGGDAAWSVPRSPVPRAERRSIWLFGDSFVERPEAPGRRAYPFVHNSVGESRCDPRRGFEIRFHWRRAAGARPPSAFFRPAPDAAWVEEATRSGRDAYYWPFDGFVLDDHLYVGLLRVVESEPRGPLALPFRLAGMDLARIENPDEPADRWRWTSRPWAPAGAWHPGAAFAIDEGFLYAFAFPDDDAGRAPRALARWSLDAIRGFPTDLYARRETLAPDGRFRRGLAWEDARIVFPENATEMSVHFVAALDAWLAIELSPRPVDGDERQRVVARRAARLEGPWSPAVTLLEIPAPETVERDRFCYAAKAHPQFGDDEHLLVTYVCSVYARDGMQVGAVLRRLASDRALYRAKAVRVPMPFVDDAAASASPSGASASAGD